MALVAEAECALIQPAPHAVVAVALKAAVVAEAIAVKAAAPDALVAVASLSYDGWHVIGALAL